MANPFFSGRIPPDLLERIEKHCAETGESKTDILINALAAYFNHPVAPRNNPAIDVSKQMFAALEERVAILENLLKSDDTVVINADNSKESPKLEEMHKQLVISIDNKSDVSENISLKDVESGNLLDNTDNENADDVIVSNASSNGNTLDNKIDNGDNNSSSEEIQEVIKASNEAKDRKHATEAASSTEDKQLPPKFELLTSAELRHITAMTQPQVDNHKKKVNQKYKKLEQTLEERKILEVPEKIESKKPITVQSYPYNLFYAGQNEKGKDLWNLLPYDNNCYQELSFSRASNLTASIEELL